MSNPAHSDLATLDLTAGWHIDAARAPDISPAATAARELHDALTTLAPQNSTQAPVQFILQHRTSSSDGFTWNIKDGVVHLNGNSARGLLYCVYSFLMAMGFSWPGHKPQDTCQPKGSRFSIAHASAESPGFEGRCLILGHHAFLAEYMEWITWAARNRLNTIFVHTAEEGLALGAVPVRQWHDVSTQVRAHCTHYGMTLELGGHGLSRLLPRTLFDEMPDAFRMKDGVRTPDHNLEPLNAQGMAEVRKNAHAWFQANPGADIYHLWPDDIPGGGWSQSPECEGLSASDQALIATNALAEELNAISPDAQIAHIAYHDTEPAPTTARPRHNVSLLWAPRMRSYADGAFDKNSSVNHRYPGELAANMALFNEANAPPTRVFEYYLDAILFKSVLPPLADLMAQDAKGYRAAGVHTLQALMVGGRPWCAPQINAYAFAHLAWRPDASPATLTRSFCAGLVGKAAADALTGHYEALANAFSMALTFEPREARPGAAAGAADFLDTPPTDMGDPWHATPNDISQRAMLRPAISILLDSAADALFQAGNSATDMRHIAGLQAEFALTRLWFDFHFARLSLYSAVHQKTDITNALAEAYAVCDAVDEWADINIADPRYRENTKLLHWLFWRLRLDNIREDATPAGAARDAVRQTRQRDMQARFARGRALWTT
ncbi:DUF4838 domain-containing protein [Pyruvatibacter sp.]|uniref:DUF4838 domain-containing protein n=1 Tax=Pyruvatibacter sp. TaxID=1981328 RepID=UPI0032EF53DC